MNPLKLSTQGRCVPLLLSPPWLLSPMSGSGFLPLKKWLLPPAASMLEGSSSSLVWWHLWNSIFSHQGRICLFCTQGACSMLPFYCVPQASSGSFCNFLSLVFPLCLRLLLLWERPSFACHVTAMAMVSSVEEFFVPRSFLCAGSKPWPGLSAMWESLCAGLAHQCLQDWPGTALLFCLWFLILVPSLAVRVDLN